MCKDIIGLFKGSNTYRHRGSIIQIRFGYWLEGGLRKFCLVQRLYGIDVQNNVKLIRLERFTKFCNKKTNQKMYWDFFSILCDPRLLEISYHKIKSNSGIFRKRFLFYMWIKI